MRRSLNVAAAAKALDKVAEIKEEVEAVLEEVQQAESAPKCMELSKSAATIVKKLEKEQDLKDWKTCKKTSDTLLKTMARGKQSLMGSFNFIIFFSFPSSCLWL